MCETDGVYIDADSPIRSFSDELIDRRESGSSSDSLRLPNVPEMTSITIKRIERRDLKVNKEIANGGFG